MTITCIRIFLITVLFLCGCSETVTSQYEARADAEADKLFERGWLPSIIPQSSFKITTKNNLDINTSEGNFAFSPDDGKEFISHLRRMDATEVSGANSVQLMERGYWPYAYRNENASWTFFINSESGHCEYQMGLVSNGER